MREYGVRVVLIEPSFTNTKLDANALRTSTEIATYEIVLTRSIEAVAKQILKVVKGPYRLRQPADGRARLLRRFAPAQQVDKSLRRAFGLAGR